MIPIQYIALNIIKKKLHSQKKSVNTLLKTKTDAGLF